MCNKVILRTEPSLKEKTGIEYSFSRLYLFPASLNPIGYFGPYQNLYLFSNCLCVPVKKTGYSGERAFFFENDFPFCKDCFLFPFKVAHSLLICSNIDVVMPKEGFVTEQLEADAPSIAACLKDGFEMVCNTATLVEFEDE